MGLELNSARGLGFDGASNMSGIFNCCAAKFQHSSARYLCALRPPDIFKLGRCSFKREHVLKDTVLQVHSLQKVQV